MAQGSKKSVWLVAALFVVLLACIWMLVGYQFRQAKEDALRSAFRETDNLARIVAAHFSSQVANLDALLQSLRTEWTRENGRFPVQANAVTNLFNSSATFSLYVSDVRGRLLYKPSHLDSRITEVLDHEAFDGIQKQTGDHLYISGPHLDPATGAIVVGLARPILTNEGALSGAIMLCVAVKEFVALYETLDLGKDGVITVRKPDGTLIVRSKLLERLMGVPLSRAAFTHPEGSFIDRSVVDDIERFFTYRSIEDLGLYVVVGYATNDAMAAFRQQKKALLWGGTISSLAVILLALIIFRNFARAEQVARLLREGESRFRSLAGLSASWYWQQDVMSRFTALEGEDIPFEEGVGKTYDELPVVFSDTQEHELKAAVDGRKPFRDIEFRIARTGGKREYYSICGLPVFDENGIFTGYWGTGRRITDKKADEAKLLFLSQYDSLTRLPNRTLMEDRLTQALANAERRGGLVAVLFLDLDHFKRVNDSLGHHVGDEVLKAVGQRLARIVRKSDTVSRLGGDEFVIILPSVANLNDIARIAEKIISSVDEPHEINGNQWYVTCSVGISVFPMDGRSRPDLLKNADAALYAAKQRGRNKFQFFTSEINERLADRLMLESDLRRAIENREFQLHYQSKVSTYTGQITGIEALIRWKHPTRGLLTPAAFISVAEECGLIPRIGEWVINEACAQSKSWQDRGMFRVPIAVNVSSLQFGQRSFLDSLDEALERTGLPAQYLELELTESAVMADGEESIAILQRLKDKGVLLTIDDFGTAYSSLNYLKRFPIDNVKIDGCFIEEIHSNQIDFAIVGAIVALAHSMSLKVIAEGVETSQQRQLVTTHWCDEMQGYLFGKPMSAEDFERAHSSVPVQSD